MRIEQRIGRLSRIGQTQDIHVFNLVAAGTVEAAVLHLLEAKLNLFELVIGEIDMILGNLDEEREFQDVVADLWAESADLGDFNATWKSWATGCWRPRRLTCSSAATTTRSSAIALRRTAESRGWERDTRFMSFLPIVPH